MSQKLQRDMAERGHSLESIKASIEARKPDFDAYIGKFLLAVNTNPSCYIYLYIFKVVVCLSKVWFKRCLNVYNSF